ncbi:putative Adenosylmethionine-8-amino-7-oxononanoate aminotransferase [Streptomyces afghaniensis 772]|uniref:Putative Adenosylmethionine-8-amino-7-oxononanoate aminotransferase n=1 Tax=Streptomyces afghaniensis 772 TaxID=1283301 RepID=S4MG89_9ACTN|nr:putative Adenosylmethionine-8-amino-7-oxononanoate aminotransferase [Streptomyces afghaniensis 772]
MRTPATGIPMPPAPLAKVMMSGFSSLAYPFEAKKGPRSCRNRSAPRRDDENSMPVTDVPQHGVVLHRRCDVAAVAEYGLDDERGDLPARCELDKVFEALRAQHSAALRDLAVEAPSAVRGRYLQGTRYRQMEAALPKRVAGHAGRRDALPVMREEQGDDVGSSGGLLGHAHSAFVGRRADDVRNQ